MKVYTYHEPVLELDQAGQQRKLEVWRESWERWGWTPIVLGRKDCGPEADGAEVIIRARPTVNPPDYTAATSLRWWALQARGGGLMTDYDVVNVGFTPQRLAKLTAGVDVCTLCSSWLPAVVWATPIGCEILTNQIVQHSPLKVALIEGRNHISDMWIFSWNPPGPVRRVCREYHETDRGEPLVHVSHASLGKAIEAGEQIRRSELMRRVMDRC